MGEAGSADGIGTAAGHLVEELVPILGVVIGIAGVYVLVVQLEDHLPVLRAAQVDDERRFRCGGDGEACEGKRVIRDHARELEPAVGQAGGNQRR